MRAWHGKRHLGAALRWVQAEGTRGHEVRGAGDGSADRTPAILRPWAERLPSRIVAHGRRGYWARRDGRIAVCRRRLGAVAGARPRRNHPAPPFATGGVSRSSGFTDRGADGRGGPAEAARDRPRPAPLLAAAGRPARSPFLT